MSWNIEGGTGEAPPAIKKRRPRRWLKWTLRVAGGGAALFVIAIACSIKPIDRTPYFTTEYYNVTRDHFGESAKSCQPSTGTLRAGFGRAKLTPTIGVAEDDPEKGEFKSLALAGYGERRGHPAEGVHDDLWVKAIAMQVGERRVVMISADALIIPLEIAQSAMEQISVKHGLRREEVYFSASHSHAGPGGWGDGIVPRMFAGPFQAGMRVWFAQQLAAAGNQALDGMSPALIGRGRFAAPDFVDNRLSHDLGRVDDEFSFLSLQNKTGSAVLGVYNAHANVVPGKENMQFSADYPGYWQRKMEEKTGGMAMFMAGAVGSHGAHGYRGFEGAQLIGEALADEVLKRLPETKLEPTTTLATFGLEIGLPPSQARVSQGWSLRAGLSRKLMPVEDHTFLQAVRLGDTLWISTPCDFSGELALDLKANFGMRGFHLTVTSFNGDYIGYVVPQYYYDFGLEYEPRIMSFYGPYVPAHLMDWMRRMGEVAIKEPHPLPPP